MGKSDVDVLIVGAGLSGIGAAVHLQRLCPELTYTILESRETIGGTWDLFRYPGVRSDSDMFTLGYDFKPWSGRHPIAKGGDILEYIRETAAENGVNEHILFQHKAISANWSSDDARWTVTAESAASGAHSASDTHGASGTQSASDTENAANKHTFTARFLYVCSGYYDYASGFTPDFPGVNEFQGTLIHPQFWPQDLDYTGKRVVVIGSGATAVTLVPAMTERAAHVTMLQRSPTYVLAVPNDDPVDAAFRRALPAKAAYNTIRWWHILTATGLYQLSQRRPKVAKSLIRRGTSKPCPRTTPSMSTSPRSTTHGRSGSVSCPMETCSPPSPRARLTS